LVETDADLRAGKYPQAEANLRAARALIDVWENLKQ
jgi:hypothetical protein